MADHQDITPRWPQMSAQERALAYSPSTMVGGDLGPFIAAYRRDSAAAYDAMPQVQTLAYGAAASQNMDLVLPACEAPVALHLFIHGGYWQELSKRDSFFAAPGTLAQGIGFAALEYTLAPDASLDQIVDEVVQALEYLQAHAAALGIDPARIVVSGSSAGAHLAAMASLRLPMDARPAGLILLSGIYDLRPLIGTYVNEALGLDQAAAERNSPSLCDLAGFPPCVVTWAEQDTAEFIRQSRQFAAHLQAAGGRAEALAVMQRNHFDIVHDLTGDSALARWLPRLCTSGGA